jgi:hypothetical protein
MSVVTNTANNASVALVPVLETQPLCRGVMFITAIFITQNVAPIRAGTASGVGQPLLRVIYSIHGLSDESTEALRRLLEL